MAYTSAMQNKKEDSAQNSDHHPHNCEGKYNDNMKNYSQKKKDLKKIILRATFVTIGLLSVTTCILLFFYITGYNRAKVWEFTDFCTGWTVNYDGCSYSDVDLKNFQLDHQMPRGQTVVLYNKVPKDWNYSTPVLRIQTHSSAVSVSVNGKEIYTYGKERFNSNLMIGSGYQFIEMKPIYKGKSIKITLTPSMNDAFTAFDEIFITDYANVFAQILTEYRVAFTIGIFLVVFGVFLITIGYILYIFTPHLVRIVPIGVFSFCVGIWTLCTYRLIQLFAVPLEQLSFIQYLSLYSGLIALTVYFDYYVREIKDSKLRKVYRMLLILEFIAVAIRLILHFTGTIILLQGKGNFFALFFLMVGCVTVLLKKMIMNGYRQGKLLVVGLVFLLIIVIMEAINCWMYIYRGRYLMNLSGIAAIGSIVFLMILLIEVGLDIAIKVQTNTEKEVLYRMAYTDELTGLYNRRYCEEKLEKMAVQKNPYGVINLDLNNLKTTNDNLGHSAGDRLIQAFADVLKQTFMESGIGQVGRMGGDEFIVLIDHIQSVNIKMLMDKLNKNMDRVNQEQKEFYMSTAYGYAQSTEIDRGDNNPNAKLVYTLADDRMYEYKKKFKKEHGLPDRI